MAQRYKFSVESKSFPLDISGEPFNTVIKTFQNHYDRILNFFNDKRTNASAESFNCKLKTFRAEFRGVNDLKFYLYRVKQLFA